MSHAYCIIISGAVLPHVTQLQSTSGLTTSHQLQSTSVPGNRKNDCTCSEISSSAVIAVSAVSLLLIVTLTTVILTQCLLMIRMRKSEDEHKVYDDVVMTPASMRMKVPITPNEAYTPHTITSKESIYELV